MAGCASAATAGPQCIDFDDVRFEKHSVWSTLFAHLLGGVSVVQLRSNRCDGHTCPELRRTWLHAGSSTRFESAGVNVQDLPCIICTGGPSGCVLLSLGTSSTVYDDISSVRVAAARQLFILQ
jgi:hypothetical protein